MPTDLNQQEGDVEAQRDDHEAHRLDARHAAPGKCFGVVGEDEAEYAQRDDHREVRGSALKVVRLLAVPQPAQEQREPAGEIDHDHVGAEQRIAPHRGASIAGESGDADQNSFETDDRERQNE